MTWRPRLFQAEQDGTVLMEYRALDYPAPILEVIWVGPIALELGLDGTYLTEEAMRQSQFLTFVELKQDQPTP